MNNFKLKFIVLTLLIPFSYANAFALLEGGVLASFNSTKFTEKTTTSTVTHDSTFDPGIGFEGRLGFKFFLFSFSANALMDYESSRMSYSSNNGSILSTQSYSNTRRRIAYGPRVMAHIPMGLRIIGEYFINVSDTITYAKPKTINPFKKDDYIRGHGWGAGLGYELSFFYIDAVYREFIFNKGSLQGSPVILSNDTYSKISTSGIYLSAGLGLSF